MNQPLSRYQGLTALLVALLCAAPAWAQSDTSVISKEFAAILLRTVSDGPTLNTRPTLVSSLPPNLASQVSAPPGGRILGAALWQTSADIVGTAPNTVDAVRTWFAQDFAKRGYTPATNEAAARFGGFREPVTGLPIGYCGNNAYYTMNVRARDAAITEFRIRIAPNFGPCVSNRTNVASISPSGRGAPLLVNPAVSERATRCSFMGPGFASTEAGFVTSMEPTAIIAHYGKQLDSLGWKQVFPAPASSMWTKADSTGRQIITVISVQTILGAPECRSAGMRIGEIRP